MGAAIRAGHAAAEFRPGVRKDAQARGSARAVGRRALLGRLRSRGFARGPRARGNGRAKVLVPGLRRDRASDAGGRPVVPSDHPRLSARRWLVHRGRRQPGADGRSDGRSGTDDRLRPHRRGVGRLGRGGHHLGAPGAVPGHRAHGRRSDPRPASREPARRPAGGRPVRRTHLRFHHRDVRPHRLRTRPRGGRGFPATPRPGGRGHRKRRTLSDHAGLLVRRHGDDRYRGHLQRGTGATKSSTAAPLPACAAPCVRSPKSSSPPCPSMYSARGLRP